MGVERKRGWTVFMWLLLGGILLIIGGFLIMVDRLGRQRGRGHEQVAAVNNARQIGLALFEFEMEYGSFPDETTATKVRQKTGTQMHFGNSSANDYFQQLVAAEIVSSPHMFYAKTAFSKKPGKPAELGEWKLEPGTVGFGYLMNGKSGFNNKEGNPGRPLACTPLALDGKTVSNEQFDVDVYGTKAVILHMDNSVICCPVSPRTRLIARGSGKTLLETGPDTIWGSKEHPVIVPPLPKR